MEYMTLERIAAACGGHYNGKEADKNREAAGVVLDSRKAEADFCFVATRGEHVDGHSFIPDVLAKGAACVVCEYIPEGVEGNFIVVQDSFQALREIAEYYRSTLRIPIIGITGSVGKTSTKEFIAGVLEQKYNVLKTEGNFNNEIGVPLTLLRIRKEHEIAVVEMGINHFGEMRRLSKMVKPDVCVMTNIGECHLEFLGSREGILRAKSEIFDYLSEDGTVYVNGDDDMLQTIERVKHKRPVRFGLDGRNDYYADGIINKGLLGCSFMLHTPKECFAAETNLPGEHMIRNALAAAAVADQYGLTAQEIEKGIASVLPVGGRSNIVRSEGLTLIDDCYNANPVSMRAAIDLLALAEGRKIAILGDMGELGENEAKYHAQIGAYAVNAQITGLICVGKLAKHMYQGACREKEKTLCNTFVKYYETLDELLARIADGSIRMDELTVLVKASHSMQFHRLVNALVL
ncbi:MAG: UDP-N-acetylmuramoyl-tripeptide--D-alanyl-D-alanine ligase [Lachnospiraceae bacterium]|nr:UDP-N-acetylmuramoyl-tripeptide--D-alanyl-D-alanine ligase [Lachnospiraceae bacterium]